MLKGHEIWISDFQACFLLQQTEKSGAFKRWIRQLHPNDVVAKSVDTLCGPVEARGSGGWATTTTTLEEMDCLMCWSEEGLSSVVQAW